MLRKPRILLVCLGLLVCVAIAIGILLPSTDRSVKLPGGGIVRCDGVTYGTNLFVGGNLLERVSHRWITRQGPFHAFGYKLLAPITATGWERALNLNFFVKHNGTGTSCRVGPQGTWINGIRVEVTDDAGQALAGFASSSSGYSVAKSYALVAFKLPERRSKTFRIRLTAHSDSSGQLAQTEFIVRNPVPMQ